MAVYDLEEQEKIDELKAWWSKYGTLIVIGLAVFAASIAGVQAWKYYQNQKIAQVAELFDSLLQVQTSGDAKKINDAAGLVMEGFPGSGYASRAAMISARASFDARDLQNAKSRLQWVLDNSKEDELKNLARLRLASILLDEKKYDDALRILETKHGTSFDGLSADLKGDVLSAAGRIPEARAAYQMALDKIGGKGTYFNIVQMKLDALLDAK
jgi:predicted negative regulator of RcsB-dependent stress response